MLPAPFRSTGGRARSRGSHAGETGRSGRSSTKLSSLTKALLMPGIWHCRPRLSSVAGDLAVPTLADGSLKKASSVFSFGTKFVDRRFSRRQEMYLRARVS
jgi:hypothetical protein